MSGFIPIEILQNYKDSQEVSWVDFPFFFLLSFLKHIKKTLVFTWKTHYWLIFGYQRKKKETATYCQYHTIVSYGCIPFSISTRTQVELLPKKHIKSFSPLYSYVIFYI